MLATKYIQKIKKDLNGSRDLLPEIFKALGDNTRLKMFSFLIKHEGLCVTDIANIFSISVPAASYQLKMLEIIGLVKRERIGQMICYKVRKEKNIVRLLTQLISNTKNL